MENKYEKLKFNPKEFANHIFANAGTENVFEIAEKANVVIIYEKWFPVTIGEFNSKNNTICVNLNAFEKVEKIIAHELGHFFARKLNFNLSPVEEELLCKDFADNF